MIPLSLTAVLLFRLTWWLAQFCQTLRLSLLGPLCFRLHSPVPPVRGNPILCRIDPQPETVPCQGFFLDTAAGEWEPAAMPKGTGPGPGGVLAANREGGAVRALDSETAEGIDHGSWLNNNTMAPP